MESKLRIALELLNFNKIDRTYVYQFKGEKQVIKEIALKMENELNPSIVNFRGECPDPKWSLLVGDQLFTATGDNGLFTISNYDSLQKTKTYKIKMDLRNSSNRSSKLASFKTGWGWHRETLPKRWTVWQSRGNELRHLPWAEALKIFDKEWPLVAAINVKDHGCLSPWKFTSGKPKLTPEQRGFWDRGGLW